jgi:hypothetical protein
MTWYQGNYCGLRSEEGIPHEITAVIQKMYENNEAQVKVGNRISTSFRTTKGLE